jgi:hypothetical protein
LVGSPAISIKNLTPGFTATPGPVSDAPFGNFGYAIDWVGPPNNNPTNVGLLSFEAFTGGAPLSLGFTNYNGQRLIFAADVYGTNGMTGNVGAVGAVPEPATWAMLIMGFGAIGATIRRRSRQAAAFA